LSISFVKPDVFVANTGSKIKEMRIMSRIIIHKVKTLGYHRKILIFRITGKFTNFWQGNRSMIPAFA